MDAEMGFVRDHLEVMEVLSGAIRAMVEHLRDSCAQELRALDVATPRDQNRLTP